MNFLAHLHLSGNEEDIRIGNFIGDFVKGSDMEEQSPRVIEGIKLHRAIDDFTDSHAVVQKSKDRLRPKYRHYAAVIVDIYYDHFLAINWSSFSDVPLRDFVDAQYVLLQERKNKLPIRAQQMLPYMISHDWLFNYQFFEGIDRVMQGMSRRSRFNSKMEDSITELKEFHSEFEKEFMDFYPDLIKFSKEFLQPSK